MKALSKVFLLLFLLSPGLGWGANVLSVATIFSNDMILQRDQPIQVWGWAPAGEAVSLSFHGQNAGATADGFGRWQATLPGLSADAVGQVLSVSSTSGSFSFSNVVLGDIWLASGQSNMEWSLQQSTPNGVADLAASADASLRVFKVYHDIQTMPREDLPAGTIWKVSTPANNAGDWNNGVSGLAYYFAKQLRTDLGIPIGILESCWGGSSCEAWVSVEALAQEPVLANAVPSTAPGVGDNHWPTGLFNGMIHPLTRFAIKGVLWDQGETNTGSSSGIAAADHKFLLPALIKDWRSRWGSNFTFLTVQLQNMSVIIPGTTPPARYSWADPSVPQAQVGWGDVRWGHFKTLELPNTGMSVNIDLNPNAYEGDSSLSYHPPNKKDFADRLLPWARELAYGPTGDHTGPLYLSYTVEGPAIRVYFSGVTTQAGGALSTTDLAVPRGFQIATATGAFVWANATIDGNSVLVSAPTITAPAKVRYAWHYNPIDPLGPIANLSNMAGFLASPFMTEDPPRMRVSGNGQDIADLDLSASLADGSDFGAMDVAANATQSFTIHNDGRGTLSLSSPSVVDLATGNAADFTLLSLPSGSIAPGGSSTFQIRFQPGGIGYRRAELRIPNNDAPRSPYRFAVAGTGTSIYSPTPTPNATATVTPTTGPTPCGEDFNFEGTGSGSTQGWGNFGASSSTLAVSAAQPHDGAYSLRATVNFTHATANTASILVGPSSGYPRDYTGKTLHAWVWVPAGMSDAGNPSGAMLFVQTGSTWAWNSNSWVNLPAAGGWTELTYNVSGVTDINQVQAAGVLIGIGATSPDWTGNIYIDSYGRAGGSCVATTPTHTATASTTPSYTFTSTRSSTPSGTPTISPTFTDVPVGSSFTSTPTFTVTVTGSFTRTATPSATLTATPSVTRTSTPSASPSLTATLTSSPTATVTPTSTPSSTFTATPSPAGTATWTPTPTASVVVLGAPGDLTEVLASPNPQPGKTLKFALNSKGSFERVEIKLYSSDNKLVWSTQVQGPWAAGWNNLSLQGPAGGLPLGVYFFKVQAQLTQDRLGVARSGRLYVLR